MTYYIIFLLLGILSFCFYMKKKLKGDSVVTVLAKTTTSALFLAAAFGSTLSCAANTGTYTLGIWLCIGLLCGLLGDIWLALKNTYNANKGTFMMAGFVMFALGHISYIAGVFLYAKTLPQDIIIEDILPAKILPVLLIGLLLGILVGFVMVQIGKRIGMKFGHFKSAVTYYSMILFGMVGVMYTFAHVIDHDLPLGNLVTAAILAVAAILFAISDVILSFLYFGSVKHKKISIFFNLLTYYMAQFLIAGCLLF